MNYQELKRRFANAEFGCVINPSNWSIINDDLSVYAMYPDGLREGAKHVRYDHYIDVVDYIGKTYVKVNEHEPCTGIVVHTIYFKL